MVVVDIIVLPLPACFGFDRVVVGYGALRGPAGPGPRAPAFL